ncbi:MAG TPA: copper chaperone PCu(A)C [Vicinamibacterales bacterium]|nr:copper chaperone PCu(A)C [Vicinamibacterales bacterium]
MAGRLVMVCAAVLALAVSAGAEPQMTASGAWVAEPSPGASSTTAYAVIENPSMYEVYVVSVTTEAAGSADIADGPAEAAKAVRELSVPAYGRTELEPGGVHIRLKDLKGPLQAGDSVTMILTLDSGATITVTAPVKKG